MTTITETLLKEMQEFADLTLADLWTRYSDDDYRLLVVCMIAVSFAKQNDLTREDLVAAVDGLYDSYPDDDEGAAA